VRRGNRRRGRCFWRFMLTGYTLGWFPGPPGAFSNGVPPCIRTELLLSNIRTASSQKLDPSSRRSSLIYATYLALGSTAPLRLPSILPALAYITGALPEVFPVFPNHTGRFYPQLVKRSGRLVTKLNAAELGIGLIHSHQWQQHRLAAESW